MPRTLKLLLFFLAGIGAAAIILVGYQNGFGLNPLIEAEREQQYPRSTPDPSLLDPAGPLSRAIYSLDESGTEPQSSLAIRDLLRTYVQRSDVIAVGDRELERHAKSWSLIGGTQPGFWIERQAWCVRIKHRERAASQFVESLFLISTLENAPVLTLPERASPLPPHELQETMARYADGLLLAVEFIRYGKSKRELGDQTWQLARDASVCTKDRSR